MCPFCEKRQTFYNTCSFLFHARNHFTEQSGSIDLENVDISIISMDIAGFLPHPDYPRIFDIEDAPSAYDLNINVKFYKPKEECIGARIVFFEPNELIFYCTIRNEKGVDEIQSMMLCQVCREIPKCEFVPVVAKTNEKTGGRLWKDGTRAEDNDDDKNGDDNNNDDDILSIHTVPDEVICLDDVSDGEAPKESGGGLQLKDINLLVNKPSSPNEQDSDSRRVNVENQVPHCLECGREQMCSMKDHFQCNDKPLNDDIRCAKCQLILPSACSLSAHGRIHDKKPPYVCPECGKDFAEWSMLFSHMEDVCFHLAKHVRFKCPAKKCGKIFAQTTTFSTHFPLQHIAVRFTCDICAETFTSEQLFSEHAPKHAFPKALAVTSYECLICTALFDTVEYHVREHCLDRDNRIYVYTCKYCKSYYRSKNTYAAHLLRCAKLHLNSQVKKEAVIETRDVQCKVERFCKRCNSKIQFNCFYKDIKTIGKTCPQCNVDFDWPVTDETSSDNNSKGTFIENACLLCNETAPDRQSHRCKFAHPIVSLGPKIIHPISPTENSSPEITSEDNSPKRKRKNPRTSPTKSKKPYRPTDETIGPIVFDGEYQCRNCDFKNSSRAMFHAHIKTHRNISTAYQCMECGECFVVKPSLKKHLLLFHKIENIDNYIEDNECFDKDAVKELHETMRMTPGETKEPVAENQCKVCRQFFSDQVELSKHFRSHGMAFLLKKILPTK